MTSEEIEQMEQLCRLIQTEQDPRKFSELVGRLNDLLEDKGHRLEKADENKGSEA